MGLGCMLYMNYECARGARLLTKYEIWKSVSEGPPVDFFLFPIFWLSGHQAIIFCLNFDWDPKLNLRPLLVRCGEEGKVTGRPERLTHAHGNRQQLEKLLHFNTTWAKGLCTFGGSLGAAAKSIFRDGVAPHQDPKHDRDSEILDSYAT